MCRSKGGSRISNRQGAFAEEESCSRFVTSAFYLRVSKLVTQVTPQSAKPRAQSPTPGLVSSGEHPFSLLLMGTLPEKMVS